MKRFCVERVLPLLLVFAFIACKKDQVSKCNLNLKFSSEYNFLAMKQLKDNLLSKGVVEGIPDTNDFVLSVVSGSGTSIYHGAYRDKPEEFILDEGAYTVSVTSIEQTAPLFSMPQYGDSQVILLQTGDVINVSFLCKHINSGMKINYSSEFKTKYPDRTTTLKSGEHILDYPYSETRIAYLKPGRVELLMKHGSKEDILYTKDMAPGMVLTVNLTANIQSVKDGMNVIVDTTKLWISENISWGDNNDEIDDNKALTVREAKELIGVKDVWVKGYIVGGDFSTSAMNSQIPFETQSNLAIADNANETVYANCMPVELKSDKVRVPLNLVTNSSNLKKFVYVKGDIEKYFGQAGVKEVNDYRLK